jgi:hypothetical protein
LSSWKEKGCIETHDLAVEVANILMEIGLILFALRKSNFFGQKPKAETM